MGRVLSQFTGNFQLNIFLVALYNAKEMEHICHVTGLAFLTNHIKSRSDYFLLRNTHINDIFSTTQYTLELVNDLKKNLAYFCSVLKAAISKHHLLFQSTNQGQPLQYLILQVEEKISDHRHCTLVHFFLADTLSIFTVIFSNSLGLMP